MSRKHSQRTLLLGSTGGFTLIEMLIVLAILGLLAGLAAVAVPAIMDRARRTADQTNLDALNTITDYYIVAEDMADPVFDPESSDNQKLLLLIDAGYLSALPIPRQSGLAFAWDEDRDVWTMGTASALTPLGSTFAEISQGFIALIEEYYAAHGNYPRSWGSYAFTDLGLDPDDFSAAIEHIIYKPAGSRLGIAPEVGYLFTVQSVDGLTYRLDSDLNWDIWYDFETTAWYYHSIAIQNQVDIATLQISAEE